VRIWLIARVRIWGIALGLFCACQGGLQAERMPLAPPQDPRPRVSISKPADDAHVVRLPVALAEIAGAALTPDARHHDLVIALDFSSSAFEPTGRDVDADGTIGTRKPWRPASPGERVSPLDWTSDPDDSVAGVELTATRTLLPRLDPSTTRVALLSFGSAVQKLAPLSSPEAALAALASADLGAQIGGTNVAGALARAARLLAAARPEARRSILLITDGFPNLPPPQQRAEDLVADEAERLAAAGVRVHVLAVATEQVEPRAVLEELARTTGGSFERVDDPTELPVRLANTSLSGVASVEVRNATTGAAGLAVRLLPDGRFDAFVPLAPGENVVEVRAHAAAGASEVARRTFRYEEPASDAPPSKEAAALLDNLRQRTLELELLTELRERRQEQRRDLRIEPTRP
jgi:hypothetical protein